MKSLIYPMFAMFILSGTVLILGLYARIGAVKSGALHLRYFKLMTGYEPTENVLKTSRNFINLFEAPVLFYTACLAAMIEKVDSPTLLGLAWLYVALRVIHTMIHVGQNNVLLRMRTYGASWMVLSAIWIILVLKISEMA